MFFLRRADTMDPKRFYSRGIPSDSEDSELSGSDDDSDCKLMFFSGNPTFFHVENKIRSSVGFIDRDFRKRPSFVRCNYTQLQSCRVVFTLSKSTLRTAREDSPLYNVEFLSKLFILLLIV